MEHGTAIKLRVINGAVPAAQVRTVQTFSADGMFKRGYRPSIAATGADGIAVAWTECRSTTCSVSAGSTSGVDLAGRESTDGGVTWSPRFRLADSTLDAKQRRNEDPSLVFGDATKRHVLWTASSADGSTSKLLLRTGSGTP